MTFTVFGSSGFIGRHLTEHLQRDGEECRRPARDDMSVLDEDLGHVLYCAGVTADFRGRPLDAIDAHVSRLCQVLRRGRFQSLLYLSSTRLYGGADRGREDAVFKVDPREKSDLYNLSKLAGEAACFAVERSPIRVVRLSNVYGRDWESNNFLMSVIRDAVEKKRVVLQTALESTKDYVHVSEIIPLLVRIARSGRQHLYNVASGVSVSSRALMDKLKELTECSVSVAPGAPLSTFPQIDISRVREEFGFRPSSVLDLLGDLVSDCRKR